NPASLNDKNRIVYLSPEAGSMLAEDEAEQGSAHPGEFAPCGCCGRSHTYGQSSVQDHQTKGDQPFQALLSTQIRVQPPGPQPATEFAPLRGRKVLVFSDSRQMAARLAPMLQTYSLNDTVRALLPLGMKLLKGNASLGPTVGLDNAFLAVL